eukprot:Partr_v1_DN28844_c2_g1_i1_m33845 putative Conserved hypothetical protein
MMELFKGEQSKLSVIANGNLLVLVRPGLLLASPTSRLLRPQPSSQREESTTEVKRLRYRGDFEVLQIVPSTDGRLLALRGRNACTVLVLPSILGRDIHLNSVAVGEFELGTDVENPVTTALWHPMSKSASHLVLLSLNGVVRVFDLTVDTQKPESVYRLHPSTNSTGSRRGGFHLAADLDVVGGCLGVGGGWLPMTLCCLLRNGDVMSLCPFLPRSGSIRRSQELEELLLSTRSALSSSAEFLSIRGRELMNARLQFLDVLESTAISADPSDPDLLHFTAPKMGNFSDCHEFSLVPQGPFRLVPTPASSLDQSTDATDILVFQGVGAADGGMLVEVPMLHVLYSNGVVDVCIVDVGNSFGPSWM